MTDEYLYRHQQCSFKHYVVVQIQTVGKGPTWSRRLRPELASVGGSCVGTPDGTMEATSAAGVETVHCDGAF